MEGVGNEVIVVLSSGLVAVGIVCFIWCRRTPEAIEELDDDNVERPPVYNANSCPICWNLQVFGVETNCGHLYCGTCFQTYYNRNFIGSSEVTCPLCRQRVGLLFLCYNSADRSSENVQLRNDISAFVRRFNRIMSNTLTLWERICEVPILLRHFLIHLLDGDEFGPNYIRLRLITFMVATITYILIPYDIFPEFIYGAYGYIEDAIAFLILVYYISRFYRNFIAEE